MLRRLRWLAVAAAVLIASAAAATPVHLALAPTDTAPDAAPVAGSFSVDSSVLESGGVVDPASVGTDLELAAGAPGFELALGGPELERDVLEGRDPIRSGTYSFSLIPEPSTLLLLAAGLAALRCRAGR